MQTDDSESLAPVYFGLTVQQMEEAIETMHMIELKQEQKIREVDDQIASMKKQKAEQSKKHNQDMAE